MNAGDMSATLRGPPWRPEPALAGVSLTPELAPQEPPRVEGAATGLAGRRPHRVPECGRRVPQGAPARAARPDFHHPGVLTGFRMQPSFFWESRNLCLVGSATCTRCC